MTGPAIDLERLRAIVEDPKKASVLPPTLLVHLKMDLAAKDATAVKDPQGIQLMKTGITDRQKEANMGPVSDALFNIIDPSQGYWGQEKILNERVGDLSIIKDILAPGDPKRQVDSKKYMTSGGRDQPTADAAWGLYLGKPQQTKSFEVSNFKPSKATDPNAEYLRIPNYIPRVLTIFAGVNGGSRSNELQWLVQNIKDTKAKGQKYITSDDGLKQLTLGNYKMDVGHDEVGPYLSYYDRWDLDQIYGADNYGRPLEIYDRMYYDPKTFVPVPEAEVLAKKVKLDLKDPKNAEDIKNWHRSVTPNMGKHLLR